MATPDIYQIADKLEPGLRRAFLEAVDELRREHVPMREIMEQLRLGNKSRVGTLVEDSIRTSLGPDQLRRFRGVLDSIVGAAGLNLAALLGVSFNMFEPRVLDWIDNVTIRLAGNVADTAVASVRTILREGWTVGYTVPQQAQMIRSVVGLTTDHTKAVGRYLEGQRASGVPEARALHNADLYSNRLLMWRADAIARTESIRAANAGRYMLWRQMVEDGTLERERLWVKWLVTDDDRLCPYCAPMEDVEVPFGVKFTSKHIGFREGEEREPPSRNIRPDPLSQKRDKLGRFAKAFRERKPPVYVLHPPLHPQCRCDTALVFRDVTNRSEEVRRVSEPPRILTVPA